ncbi:alkaline phosphatase PhoX [Thiomicrorhabdus sp.]|uniref:alkaline phosphatase PhoX n=1 Tax=Thiomicrorhabdus sp. TaxID=2039724 RepID=UPI0029C92FC0|nr:alkaline phosphatase PhoX [Thiomicrorhabdus sp.]
MKLKALYAAMGAALVAASLTACNDSSDDAGSTAQAGTITSKVAFSSNATCPNGGVTIYSGIDENGNGVLDEDERDTEDHVCNGTDGKDGQDGVDGQDGASAQLIRYATAPLGAEFTGMFVTDNNFFFNIQHPANQNAKVFVSRGDMANVGVVQPLALPATSDEKESTQVAYGQIAKVGEEGVKGVGSIKAIDGTELFISNDPDFNAFVPKNAGDDSEGFLFTNWENRPGGMSRIELKYENGAWTASNEMMVDFSSVKGTWVNCFGTLSPWGNPLTSEELYFDNTKDWHGNSQIEDLDAYLGATESPNPYRYGYIVEITNPTATPTPVKRFALGRFSHENSVVMPDNKTVYLSDDGGNTVFFKFVADSEGDLSAGTLYAAKVTQDAASSSSEAGFGVEWIELAHGTEADIEAKIATFDGKTAADADRYVTDEQVAAAATDSDASNDWIAFVETRKFAAAKGASAEFNKMEGVNIHYDRVKSLMAEGKDAFAYMAMSDVSGGMSDGSGDIQLEANRCGVVYQMKLAADYNIDRMEPAIIGGPYNASAGANKCHVDSVSNPDNLVVLADGRVIVGEDTSKHENNMMWLWDPKGGKFVIKSTGSVYEPVIKIGSGFEINGTKYLEFSDSTFSAVSVESNKDWLFSGDDTYGYSANMNGYGADKASEDWLVSKEVDLSAVTGAKLNLDTKVEYTGPALNIMVSEDYTNNVSTATWTDVTANATLASGSDWTNSGNIDLSAFDGKKITVAVKYTSTGTGGGDAASWSVANVTVYK